MEHNFTIPGEPVAKQRPRVTKRGITYTPDKTVNYCNLVKWSFQQSAPELWIPLDKPIIVSITARFTRPKSQQKATRKTTKPDVDNIAKSILDSLNGLAWVDDARVYKCTVEKEYAVNTAECFVRIFY